MRTPFPILLILLSACTPIPAQNPAKQAWLDAEEAGQDFDVQGEYEGKVGDIRVGVQVIADGDGKFRSVGYLGGLPGNGWNGVAETKIPGTGRMDGDVCVLKATSIDQGGRGEIQSGNLTLFDAEGTQVAELPKVVRESPTLWAKPPAGAVVLFDGSSADHFKGGRMTENGLLMEGVTSRPVFDSYKLHLEFQLSFMPFARGQGRANSGCYHQGRYEVQILDSFGLTGEDNECGGIYKIARPRVNMCFPPLSWQTYDVEFHAAEFDADGQKTANAWITVKHNGVVIHEHQELPHSTTASPLKEGPEPGPIYLQNHGNPIRFRNIWVVPAETPDA